MDVTSLLDDSELEELFDALSRDDLEAAWPLFDVAEERAGATEAGGGGNENELRRYWLSGAGGRSIRWHTGGAFARCVAEVSATGARGGLTNVKGYCASLYHDARGEWPGKSRRAGKKPAGPQKIDYVRRTPRNKKEAGVESVTELGRVLEARGAAADGGRVFRVRVISVGDSANGRRYSESVLREAAHLYEGARVYDHHRTDEEMRTSTINGLVGSMSNVEATAEGIDADLHLLPGTDHAAAVLDASIAAQEAGLPGLAGISHDAMAHFAPLTESGRQLVEATSIVGVNSADIVAVPAAGGRATRVLAGGEEPLTTDDPAPSGENESEDDVPVTTDGVLAALKEATAEQLAAVGLARATEAAPAPEAEPTKEAAGDRRDSFAVRLMVDHKVRGAKLPEQTVESVLSRLPELVTEADVDREVQALADLRAALEPIPTGVGPTATVGQESLERKREALDAFFEPGNNKGFRSFRQAFTEITGQAPKGWDEDFNRTILRESMGASLFDSGARATESLTTTSWDQILGDSITRRMVAEYSRPSLQTWRQIVSSVFPVNDFRTQRVDRLGGYGTLPAVNQGAPYQPLTSPGDEEATYAITKRGGTEDITLEMIANDDVRSISRIPQKLGLAAAQTLYRFVWDILPTNAATSYDSTTLFHTSSHGANSAAAALSTTAVEAGRVKMRQQAGYGDTADILSIVPKFLVVPSALEPLAWQICTSAVAIPSGAPVGAASDIPNLHQGMTPIVIDYYSDANDWYMIADPSMVPTIEIGFYQGREAPELFTQSDPSVGSMFNSDTLTWKIRHIYSGTVIDHRGFYRGTQ